MHHKLTFAALFIFSSFFAFNCLRADESPKQQRAPVLMSVSQVRNAENKALIELHGYVIQRDGNFYLRDKTGMQKLDVSKMKSPEIIFNKPVSLVGFVKTNLLRLLSNKPDPTVLVMTIKPLDSDSL